MSSTPILFIDDDDTGREYLIRSLLRRDASLNCISADSEIAALAKIKSENPQIIILDLSLNNEIGPDSGLNLISKILTLNPNARILVLTGHTADIFGIQALNNGAASFLSKPTNPDHLLALIYDAQKFANLTEKYLNATQQVKSNYPGLIFNSDKMFKIAEQIDYAASNDLPVVIFGETGTGKGIVAQAIFEKQKKHKKNLITYCPSFTNNDLINSELFGHNKGAFTGATETRKGLIEEADKGTLFMDEIAELPADVQLTLLRVIQEKKFRVIGSNKEIASDFRLISATNKDVDKLIEQEKFRLDLYHRISHIIIKLPALRERRKDILPLAEHFIRNLNCSEKLSVYGLSQEVSDIIINQEWPGNIRELRACIEASAFFANFKKHRIIEISDLQNLEKNSVNCETDKQNSLKHKEIILSQNPMNFRDTINDYELQLVQTALEKFDNNQSKAAKFLNLDRTSLIRIINRKIFKL